MREKISDIIRTLLIGLYNVVCAYYTTTIFVIPTIKLLVNNTYSIFMVLIYIGLLAYHWDTLARTAINMSREVGNSHEGVTTARKSETPIGKIAKVLQISTRDNKIQGAKKRPHMIDDSESEAPLKRPKPMMNMTLESYTGMMGPVGSLVRPNKRALLIEEEESADCGRPPKKRFN